MAITISFITEGEKLIPTSKPIIASGDRDTVTISVAFDSSWDGYAKSGVFLKKCDKDHNVYEAIMDSNNSCIIPHEALDEAGTTYIGIRGVNGASVYTSSLVAYRIDPGAPEGTTATVPPTASVYQQLLTANAVLSSRVDEIASLPAGGTSGDAELRDIRVGADGMQYPNAGAAVRGQIDELKWAFKDYNYYNFLLDGEAKNGSGNNGRYTYTVGTDGVVHFVGTSETTTSSIGPKYHESLTTLPGFLELGEEYLVEVHSSNPKIYLQVYYTLSNGTTTFTYYKDGTNEPLIMGYDSTGIAIRVYVEKGFVGECDFFASFTKRVPARNRIVKSLYERHKPFTISEDARKGFSDLNLLSLNPIYRVYRSKFFDNFRVQCAINIDGGIYVIGNNGTGRARITQITSYDNAIPIRTLEWEGGHCNDATYDADTNKLYVTCGGAGASATEGTTRPNQISVIDMSSFAFEKYVTIDDVGDAASIEIYGIYWIVRDNQTLYKYSFNGNTFTRLETITTLSISALLGSDSEITRQAVVEKDDILYILFGVKSANYLVFDRAMIVKYDLKNREFVGILASYVAPSDEAEGLIFDNNRAYVFTDGNYFGIYESFLSEQNPTRGYKTLDNVTDLDNCLAPGEYFSRSSTITQRIANKPAAVVGAFTMIITNQEGRGVLQTITPTLLSAPLVEYKRILLSDGRKTSWYKITGELAD